jgi:hypothetical protein
MTTIEDLDRRVSALEKASQTEKNIIRAVSEIVVESETRIKAVVSASEKRVIKHFDEVLDRILVKLDAPKDGK